MRKRADILSFEKQAPRFLGAVFYAFVLLVSSGCDKKDQSPNWIKPAATSLAATTPAESLPPPSESVASGSIAESGEVRFITYNVENWLTTEPSGDGKTAKGKSKPERQKQAVIQLLARHAPDVIGLCEIGTPDDLAEIQGKLKAAGVDLPYSHYTGGIDPVRHLGFLSRFPIKATASAAVTTYSLAGRTFSINRGILDASVIAHQKTYRFVGTHLKSKRDSDQGDQEAIRFNEALLLRRHVDSILQENANARLIIYGDFNDTRASPSIKTIVGYANRSTDLTAIPIKDSRQETWTHCWELNDIYSRIDYIMVSDALRKEVDFSNAKIIDDAGWNDASDHRPVMAVFK
jgi:endonuclease/exonuclease/phosphatase family metal-dependent hydrolase